MSEKKKKTPEQTAPIRPIGKNKNIRFINTQNPFTKLKMAECDRSLAKYLRLMNDHYMQ